MNLLKIWKNRAKENRSKLKEHYLNCRRCRWKIFKCNEGRELEILHKLHWARLKYYQAAQMGYIYAYNEPRIIRRKKE